MFNTRNLDCEWVIIFLTKNGFSLFPYYYRWLHYFKPGIELLLKKGISEKEIANKVIDLLPKFVKIF